MSKIYCYICEKPIRWWQKIGVLFYMGKYGKLCQAQSPFHKKCMALKSQQENIERDEELIRLRKVSKNLKSELAEAKKKAELLDRLEEMIKENGEIIISWDMQENDYDRECETIRIKTETDEIGAEDTLAECIEKAGKE